MTAEVNTTKCLFRIEPSKKNFRKKQLTDYYYGLAGNGEVDQKVLNEKLNQVQVEQLDYDNLVKQSVGMPVSYGQGIVLRHMYSDAFVTFEIMKAARLIGNVQVSLIKADGEYTSLKIMPLSKMRKVGEVVRYSEEISFVNLRRDHYNLHVSEFLNSRDEGLEVNGSQTTTEWKPQLFLTQQKQEEIYSNPNILIPGEVVQLHNGAIGGGYLSITRPSLSNTAMNISVITTDTPFDDCSNYMHKIPINYPYYYNLNCMGSEICITHHQNFYTLWEIQRIRTFDNRPLVYPRQHGDSICAVRLKNVASGFYLSSDPKDDYALILTSDGLNDENIFFLTQNSQIGTKALVSKGDQIRIKNFRGLYIQPMKQFTSKLSRDNSQQTAIKEDSKFKDFGKTLIPDLTDEANKPGLSSPFEQKMFGSIASGIYINTEEFQFGCSTKSDPSLTSFEIIESDSEILETAQMLSSILGQMRNFHDYLQDWAMKTKVIDKKRRWCFVYQLAVQQEEELATEVKLLNESLKSVYDYLLEDSDNFSQSQVGFRSVKARLERKTLLSYEQKKELLIAQNILELLILILKLIEFKTKHTRRALKSNQQDEKKDKDGNPIQDLMTYDALQKNGMSNSEKIPQVIAHKLLDKVTVFILQILILAAWNNAKCSQFLASQVDFFKSLLIFYPDEVTDLACEIAKNLECNVNIHQNFYVPWLNLLADPSEKLRNLQQQTRLLKLFTSLTWDHKSGKVFRAYQNTFYEMLFKKKSGTKRLRFLSFKLDKSQTGTCPLRIVYAFPFVGSLG